MKFTLLKTLLIVLIKYINEFDYLLFSTKKPLYES